MEIRATTDDPPDTGADTVVVGVFEGKGVPHDVPDGALQALVDVRRGALGVPHAHPRARRGPALDPGRLGDARRRSTPSARGSRRRSRSAARASSARATLCWELPHKVADAVAGALVEGTLLAAYRYTAFKSEPGEDRAPEALVVSAHHDVAAAVEAGRAGAEAANRARDLGNAPANVLTPEALAARARALDGRAGRRDRPRGDRGGRHGRVRRRRAGRRRRAAADHDPPRAGRARPGRCSGSSARRVTFDTGGYSIKPAARMHEMKFDMCGGAAVLEATGAIAQLGLPVRLVERDRRDGEHGLRRARAARATSCARRPGSRSRSTTPTPRAGSCSPTASPTRATRAPSGCVDVATLTGGIVTTFGSVHAGLMGNDDDWCAAVTAAGEATGERVWRLPLDPLYDELIKGRYADIMNVGEGRKAHVDHRRRVPAPLRRRRAVGAPRHRRRRRRPRPPVRAEGRVGLGRAAAGRARPQLAGEPDRALTQSLSESLLSESLVVVAARRLRLDEARRPRDHVHPVGEALRAA